jgi:ABC-type multidrug transport system ATPase subunit
MEEAEVLSDRVAIMNNGVFIAMGTPKQIIEKYGSGSTCMVKSANDAALRSVQAAGMTFEVRNGDIWVTLDDRLSLAKLVTLLSSSEATYEEVLIKGSTLEDVFLKLTGNKLAEVSP